MLIVVGVSYAVLERLTPVYRATTTVVVSPKAPRVIADIKEVVELGDGGRRRDFNEYIRTQLDRIKSQEVSAAVLDEHDLWSDERLFPGGGPLPAEAERAEDVRRRLAVSLAKRIKARRVPDSLIIEIQFEHTDAKLAALMANTVAETYQKKNLERKQSVLTRAREDLEKLLTSRLQAKQRAEGAIKAFEKGNNIRAVGTRQKEVSSDRKHYNEKVREANERVVMTRNKLEAVNKAKKRGIFGVGVAEVLSNPVLSELKLQYVTLKNQVAELGLIYGHKHPKLKSAKSKLNQVASLARREIKGIFQKVESDHEQAMADFSDLKDNFDAARDEDEKLGNSVQQYAVLEKEFKEQTQLYDRIRRRHEETTITTSLALNNVSVLDRALVPRRPVWPRKVLVMAGSAVLGLLLGFLLVFVLERSDTSIRDKDHAETIVDAPCLGVVPTIHVPGNDPGIESVRARDLYVHDNPLSQPAEMARTLRTNLLFLSAEKELHTLLITSALPQEGKTTLGIQTSIALASAGGRTILLEADMRRPRLAETLQVSNKMGLSTYLANRETGFRDVVQQTAIPNLDVIVCGLIPPNPAELLNSLRLNQLLAQLHEHYDMVIIDSPPINAVSDALVMASRVDGVLLVAKCKRTTTEALKSAYAALVNVQAPVLGTVLNDLHHGRFGYYRGKYYRRGYYRRGYYRRDADEMYDYERMDADEANPTREAG